MNYLLEIRAFDDSLETNSLNSNDIALWFAIMNVANKTGWKSEFSVAAIVLFSKSGLKKDPFYNSRNKLKNLGYIDFKERKGNQATVYIIKSLVSGIQTQSTTQSTTQSATQSTPQSANINKQNKTKQNNIKKTKAKKDFALQIDDFTQNETLKESLMDFIDMRKHVKKPLTENAFNLSLKKLEGLSTAEEEQIQIVNEAVEKSWLSFYALKQGVGTANNKNDWEVKTI